jgi:hypothetical protein
VSRSIRTRFPLLLYQLAKAGEHEFAFLLDRFISEAAERIQENSGRSFVRLSRCGERNLKFGLSHAAVSQRNSSISRGSPLIAGTRSTESGV